jgi:hypothetical protein
VSVRTAAVARFFSGENRYLPPIFITLILLVGNLSFGLLESFSRTALAIGTSMVFEIALTLLVYRKFRTWQAPTSLASASEFLSARRLSGRTLCVALFRSRRNT